MARHSSVVIRRLRILAFRRMSFALTSVALLIGAFALAQSSGLVQDSRRRQALQRQVEAWADREARPVFAAAVTDLESLGVRILEPTTVLPADLGGPRPGSVTRIDVELWASGYGDDLVGGRHDGFGRFHRTVRMECRLKLKLMARVGRDGRPVDLIPHQKVSQLVACASRG